jgi:ubiquinone/menaquinone biosynthesis C-methylase UbiE
VQGKVACAYSALNTPFARRYSVGGYNRLVNIDLSSVVIKQQASKYPEQIWKVANALNMDFPDRTFPVVIDKSLIDTLLCASGRYIAYCSCVSHCSL